MKPIISVEGLGKSYTICHEGQTNYKSLREEIFKLPLRLLQRGGQSREEFWALKDVSFDIMPGDRVGIIGRNGAGKSTLLKLLSRITAPTTGRITLRGRVASLLEVGTGFHPELTGRENIYLNGAILGMTRSEVRRKFDEIVDFAGVEKFLDTPVKRYSSGMYVRLAFAVAAHLEPEILIVDEVLAVGDVEFQKKCLGKMEEVGKGGRTVLFVSHNLSAIQTLCNSAFLIQHGKCIFNGTVARAIDLYKSSEKTETKHTNFIKNINFFDEYQNKENKFKKFPKSLYIEFKKSLIFDKYSYLLLSINKDDKRVGIIDTRDVGFQGISTDMIEMIFYQDMILTAGMYYINIAYFNDMKLVNYAQGISHFEIENYFFSEKLLSDYVILPQLICH